MTTRNRRAAAIGIALATQIVLPAPDGTIDQADRQHLAFCYPGILAGAATIDESWRYLLPGPSTESAVGALVGVTIGVDGAVSAGLSPSATAAGVDDELSPVTPVTSRSFYA